MKLRSALLAAAVLLVVAPAQAKVGAGTRTVTQGNVTATFSWAAGKFTTATKPHLKIVRDGATMVDADLAKSCQLCTDVGDPKHALHLRDLLMDGDPEVMVDLYSGGAHCCYSTVIYGFASGAYHRSVQYWGSSSYGVKQLDGDGVADLLSADDRFSYEFVPYVASWRPIQIFNYGGLRLVDRTRRFTAEIRKDMRLADETIVEARKLGDARGIVAGRVADMALLGQDVDAYLQKALARGDLKGSGPYPAGRKYIAALKKFLRRTGYI